MTLVNVVLTRPQSDGVNLPVNGWLEWTPTASRNASPELVLPVPFQTNLTDAAVTVEVAPTGPAWCWEVSYRVQGFKNLVEYVAVPTVGPVFFGDLARVDPATLTPTAVPDPAWYAYTDGLAASAAQAANLVNAPADTVMATVITTPTSATAAALSAAYAPVGLRRRDLPRMPTVIPAPMATPPTEATSGPGGAGPITSPTTLPYNTPNVTFLGSVPVHVTALSTDYFQNQVNSQSGSGAQPCAVEFDYYGSAFSIIYRAATAGSSYWWVWVDGIPATSAPVAWANTSSNSKYYHGVTFASSALRRIRIYYSGADFGGMQVKVTDSVVPTAKPGWSMAVLGDSYTQATGATSALQAFPTTLGLLLGCETFLCGIAGTGYTAGTVFGDPTRTAPIKTANPRYVVIVGSINDSAATPATVGDAATALYSWFATNLPQTKLFVVGVQPSNGMATTGNNVDNNAALKTAALASPNVVAFIDPYTDAWFTGTGRVGAPVGDGNRDIFMYTDAIHPSQDGHDYWARRIYADVAATLTA